MRSRFFLIVLFSQFIYSQSPYPKDDFRPPLDIPLLLAGNFGELRSNHFHSGIDIKTQQREGLPVYAIADGHISRIKIQHYGFGKALYVTHLNGYTSVYAHLQKLSPELEAFIKKNQYEKHSYEIELFPNASDLIVHKGDLIAYTGNTGGSEAPHLHFEIRDAKEKPINPLYFGMEVKDTKVPTINGLYGYSLDNSSHVNQSGVRTQINIRKQNDGTFLADKVKAFGKIGLGLNAYDGQDLTYNKNGVYDVKMTVNGSPYFEYAFDTFSFDETLYINTFIDYEYYISKRTRIQRCFVMPYNKLSIYKEKVNDGVLFIENGLTYNVELEVRDWHGNKSIIKIPIEGVEMPIVKEKEVVSTPHYLKASRENIFESGNVNLFFPENTFYEDLFLDLQYGQDSVRVHNNSVPLHKNYTLSMDVSKYPATEREKMLIAGVDSRGRLSAFNTYKKGDIFSIRTKSSGLFTLAKDTIPPVITPINFKSGQWLSNYRYLRLKITDDLSGINTYTATINGQWILMEYEYKDNTITFNFDDIEIDDSKNELKVIVTDNVGNSTTFETIFYRKK